MKISSIRETGEENAHRFVRVVQDVATAHKVIVLYADPGQTAYTDPEKVGWTWMKNRVWRQRVLDLLVEKEIHVTEAKFLPPDELDGWVFLATSVSTRHRVEDLTLDKTLEKRPLTMFQRLKWFFTATVPTGELG